jgi:hypothetical protein
VYAALWLDNQHHLWQRFGLDYSTHSAFAASVALSLGTLRRTWAGALAGSVILYFGLVLALGYHGMGDILAAAALAAATTGLAHWSLRQRPAPTGEATSSATHGGPWS